MTFRERIRFAAPAIAFFVVLYCVLILGLFVVPLLGTLSRVVIAFSAVLLGLVLFGLWIEFRRRKQGKG